jgi:hypothetical protein
LKRSLRKVHGKKNILDPQFQPRKWAVKPVLGDDFQGFRWELKEFPWSDLGHVEPGISPHHVGLTPSVSLLAIAYRDDLG